ncbi:MAG: preprotein translocase subunit SecG [Chloroflexi bacterium RBG_16_57_11]|nr:MAG: preprotein translocase subunit SecG [Chloroflexi bacterium RBG_16_57_11]
MEFYLDIALIITSIALIISVILQSKGAGLGGLTGGDSGGIFTARRGIEKVLFRVTIVLSVVFFSLAIAATLVTV